MKKLFASFLVVPIFALFIFNSNVFSKSCNGDNKEQGYLKSAQINQPSQPDAPQLPATPNKPSPKIQNNKPKQSGDMPGQMKKQKPDIMKKNKSGKPGQSGDMPGQMKKQ